MASDPNVPINPPGGPYFTQRLWSEEVAIARAEAGDLGSNRDPSYEFGNGRRFVEPLNRVWDEGNVAPVSTISPVISGTSTVGSVLAVSARVVVWSSCSHPDVSVDARCWRYRWPDGHDIYRRCWRRNKDNHMPRDSNQYRRVSQCIVERDSNPCSYSSEYCCASRIWIWRSRCHADSNDWDMDWIPGANLCIPVDAWHLYYRWRDKRDLCGSFQ